MYDCLVLVKKYRNCLRGFTLEFPSETVRESDNIIARNRSQNNISDQIDSRKEEQRRKNSKGEIVSCRRRQLVSRFLDGDDPIYQSPCTAPSGPLENILLSNPQHPSGPFAVQYDDKGSVCELVHVPINGLLDRLKNYNESGIAVDSRVYAFAMGLKTAERILTTNSMKELQETPI